MIYHYKYLSFVSVLLFLFVYTKSYSQNPKLRFKHITTEEGLSNSTIETIFKDSRGFMWFGSRDGLNRYDGYQITVYRFNSKDSNSISDNYINCIYEDSHHTLWIGTNNGLNRFDPAKGNFTRYQHNAKYPGTISHNLVTGITEDSKGNLWISTLGGGINLFNRNADKFTRLSDQQPQPKGPNQNQVYCIYPDQAGNLWAGTASGLMRLDARNRSFTFYQLSGHKAVKVRVIKQDKKGLLWIGTEDKGLFSFDLLRHTVQSYQHKEKDHTSLGSDLVRSILVDQKGVLWVGGVNAGLNVFRPETGSFYQYEYEADDPYSLSQRTVSALFEDKQGNLWVGTHRGGVNLYTPAANKFNLYRQESKENSLSHNDVKAFCEDSKGNIWIGTDGGGMNLFDRTRNTFRHYRHNPYNARSLGSNEVLHIMEDSENNLWVGTWGGGLNLYNRNGTFTRFNHNPAEKNTISSDYVQKIYEDSHKNLWIATYYGGLQLFDRKTRTFTRFKQDPEGRTHLSGNNIVSLLEDKQGRLWIGTDDGGLNSYDPKKKRIFHYFNNEEKMPDLRVIFLDSKGRLWIGQAGLYLFNPSLDTFSLYTEKAGLAKEFIKGITEDEQGNFWISSSNGLTKFNPETESYKKYNTGDGLQGLEYEANAYLKTRNGQMFFGGVKGFNSFHPKQITFNQYIPPVYVTDFQIFYKKILPGEKNSPLSNDISVSKGIKLTYQQSTLSFGFTALNFTASENNQYAYKLEGLDTDWIYSGVERKATYTNLAPGTYIFHVKAANNDGLWNTEGSSIRIVITPPFWETWWFTTLILLCVVTGVMVLLSWRRKLELQKLEEKKKEEVHQMQLEFFTNISHDFRTPLSLIISPLEKMIREDTESTFVHYYKIMYRNANRLLGLVNELMDYRKTASGVLKLKVMAGNISLFLNEISEEFSGLAEEKQIEFLAHIPENISPVWFDRQVVEKVMINIISNAFKFTPTGGCITLEVFTSIHSFKPSFKNELLLKSSYNGRQYLFIRIADNGIGISKEAISHLFDRYYRINDAQMGSGIGLAFIKSLVLLHKGSISVYSEQHKGTEIIVALPVHKDDYTKEEIWVNGQGPKIYLESIQYKPEFHLPSTTENNPLPVVNGDRKNGKQKQHILIVEDNDELRSFIINSLQTLYYVSEAKDGQEGLNKAQEEMPDLIISDVMMPVMNGIEFCKRIKEDIQTSHIPFMMLTAKDSLASQIEGAESGADHYFTKPLSIDLLLLKLRNLFYQRQKLTERYLSDHHTNAKELAHSTRDKDFIQQLLDVVEGQLANPEMDIEFICTQMGMSKTKLYQKLKGITGQSIGEFVRTTRLKKAVQIMSEEDVLLSDVMYRVGIQTQSYFTKAFKKEYGKTPSQYLQEIKK